MAVLIEGYSVVIKGEEILRRWPGGWEQFKSDVPNKTMCADGELIRVGFMNYEDAMAYATTLEAAGIMEATLEISGGYVHVDQLRGLKTNPDWVEFGYTSLSGDQTKRIALCRLVGDKRTEVALPEGWKYEGSLSAKPNFVSKEEADKRLEKIRRRDGVEVYYDKHTRKQVFVGRTGDDVTKQ